MIISPSCHHLVLPWLFFSCSAQMSFQKRTCIQLWKQPGSWQSTIVTPSQHLSWDHTLSAQYPANEWTQRGCRGWHVLSTAHLSYWAISFPELIITVAKSFQICVLIYLPILFPSIFHVIGFRSLLYSEVFPCEHLLPFLYFLLADIKYNNLSECLSLSQGLLPEVLNWHKFPYVRV